MNEHEVPSLISRVMGQAGGNVGDLAAQGAAAGSGAGAAGQGAGGTGQVVCHGRVEQPGPIGTKAPGQQVR